MDDEAITGRLLRQTVRRARKEHTCRVCKRTIEVGKRYVSTAAIIDGDFYASTEHEIDYMGDCIVR